MTNKCKKTFRDEHEQIFSSYCLCLRQNYRIVNNFDSCMKQEINLKVFPIYPEQIKKEQKIYNSSSGIEVSSSSRKLV